MSNSNSKSTPHEVENLYKDIVKANGVTDPVSKVIVTDAGLQGEGFASVTQCVTIVFKDDSKKPLNLFAKTLSPNPVHTELMTDSKSFEKEARFFMEFVPAAETFCKSKGLKGLMDFLPKCYYGDQKLIVLENLGFDKGYEVLDKRDMQDLEGVKFAITTLAKFHAVAHAMVEESGGQQKFFERFLNLDWEIYSLKTHDSLIDPLLETGVKTSIKILEKTDVIGRDVSINLLSANLGNYLKIVKKSLEPTPNFYSLLNHGDYWNNNMMFKKDVNGKVVGHKAIDIQICRYNSPATDLSYYLYTSVKPDVRRAHLKEIFQIYFDVLSSTASKLGYPVPLTLDELFFQYRHKLQFGFWFGFSITNEAGYAILNKLDISKMTDLSDWSVQFDTAVNGWIDENPHRMKPLAEATVSLLREYMELVLE